MNVLFQRRSYRLLCLLFLTVCYSCQSSEPECYEPVEVKANSSFVIKNVVDTGYYVITNPGSPDSTWVDTTLVSYRDSFFNAIAMVALDVDVQLGVLGVRTSILGVPLNPFTDSQRYQILLDTADLSLADTITFFYHTEEHFISNNCGYTHYFHIDSARTTFNFMDSVVLSKKEVTNDNSVRNLFLYFF